uniref:G domain-containing protein n=1 Tax=Oncorhynchus mykiss TaxID=8022 RepID=A0A8L0DT76_ONCMY
MSFGSFRQPVKVGLTEIPAPVFGWGTPFSILLHRETLMESISSYKPDCEALSEARVLLLGTVGVGKSSFISSVQSVFTGRFTNCFGHILQLFNIRGQSPEQPTALVLCDVMGLGDGETAGLTLHDTLAIIKGHAPEGHKVHEGERTQVPPVCVRQRASIGSRVSYISELSNRGVHQVALLTQLDKVRVVQALLGMSTSYIVPVKNYSSELDVDENTDIYIYLQNNIWEIGNDADNTLMEASIYLQY